MTEDVFGIVGTVQGGSFRVEEVVAEGGFAVVYRAYHGAFRASVALKCLKVPGQLSKQDQKDFLEKFREEAELLFRLSQTIPTVVRPLHVGTLGQQPAGRFVPFIAIEWLEGRTLDDMVQAQANEGRPPMNLKRVLELLTPVSQALDKAHKFPGPNGVVSIIHRDLKPENIFIASIHGEEIPKILDFGIAKVKSAATQIVGRQSANENQLSAFTPAYGAPEQWLPKRYGQTGPWTDVWGLALTAVECLCGHTPIDGDQAAMMGAAIDPERRPTPGAEGVTVSADIESVFQQALAVDPRERFHDVSAFWSALSDAAGAGQPAAGSPPPVRPPQASRPADGATAVMSKQGESVPPDPNGRTVAVPSSALEAPGSAEVPDLFVGGDASKKPETSAPAAAPKPASSPRAAKRPVTPPQGGLGADQGYMLGNTIDSFDDAFGDAAEMPATLDTLGGVGLSPDRAVSPMRSRPRNPNHAFEPAPFGGASAEAKLDLRAPVQLMIVAIMLMAGDYLYATFMGEILRIGPARTLWLAGPIAVVGVAMLAKRLLSHGD